MRIAGQILSKRKADIVVEQGKIQYHLPFASQSSTAQARRAGRARQVSVFEPAVEPIPEDLCEETSPGKFMCDFGAGLVILRRHGRHLTSFT